MAVNKVSGGIVLSLEVQAGVNTQGNPVYRGRNYKSIDPSAADQDLYDVAQTIAGLQSYTLSKISRVDNAQIVEA